MWAHAVSQVPAMHLNVFPKFKARKSIMYLPDLCILSMCTSRRRQSRKKPFRQHKMQQQPRSRPRRVPHPRLLLSQTVSNPVTPFSVAFTELKLLGMLSDICSTRFRSTHRSATREAYAILQWISLVPLLLRNSKNVDGHYSSYRGKAAVFGSRPVCGQ